MGRYVDSFTEALYQWDAAIQDHLASASFGESSAYQLGRGLAECSWALDPNWPPNEVMGWEHVLGSERCVALTRLLERPDTRPADGNSLRHQRLSRRLAAGRAGSCMAERYKPGGPGIPAPPGQRVARHVDRWRGPANIRAGTQAIAGGCQHHSDHQRVVGSDRRCAVERRNTRGRRLGHHQVRKQPAMGSANICAQNSRRDGFRLAGQRQEEGHRTRRAGSSRDRCRRES
jgi:hypothetical protein